MATFIFIPKYNQEEAQYVYDGIRKWFQDNPDRDDCQTLTALIRRDHIKKDLLKECVVGVILKEKPQNTDFKDSLPEDKPKKKRAKKINKDSKANKTKATQKKSVKKSST